MFLHLSVILSTGGCPWAHTPQADTHWADKPPQADTPLGRHPQADTPWSDNPPGRHPPGQTPPWADILRQTPPRQTHIHLGRHPCPVRTGIHNPPLHSTCWDTVNKQALHILLECIIVFGIYIFGLNTCKVCRIIKF